MTDDLLECYRILELEPGATPAEVKQAYRDLAKIWHPDRFPNEPRVQEKAQEKLKEINRAYEQLKNCRPGKVPAPANHARRGPRPQGPGTVQPHYDEVDSIEDGRKTATAVVAGMLGVAAVAALLLYTVHVNNQQGAQHARLANDEMEARRLLAEAQAMREREAKLARVAEQTRQQAELRQKENEKALQAYYASQTNSRWRAFAEYRKATEQAVKDAEANLTAKPLASVPPSAPGAEQYERGSNYANGRGVPQDYQEAVKWYRQAAELGHASAQHYLGFHYFVGRGVAKDYVEAYKWLALAAGQGEEQANKNLTSFTEFMTPFQLEAGRRAVAEFRASHDPDAVKQR